MTTPTASQLQTALANFVDNLDNKLDTIINGDSSTDVTVDSGTVPTIAKLFNQMTGTLTTASFEFTASASQTDFVCTGADIPGVNSVIVSVDGDTQAPSTYSIQTTTTTNDTVRLASGLSGGEAVEVRLLAAPQSIGTGDATNINYSQGSTGYSVRKVEDKFRTEELSLLDFGADPTGVASSAGALSSAIDAAMALGIPLRIPAGTYTLSSWTTKTTTADLTIIGDPGALLDYTGGVSTAYFLTPAHSTIIRGVEFDGFPRVISQGTHGGTRIDRFEFVNCKVTGAANRAIYMLQPFEMARVVDNIFDGTGTAHTTSSLINIGVGGTTVAGDYRNLVLDGNTIENYNLENAGTQRLIDVMVEKSSISRNVIRNIAKTVNTNQVELVRIVGNQNLIEGNVIDTFTNTSSVSVVKAILVQGQLRTGSLGTAPTTASTGLFGYANIIRGNRVKDVAGVTNCFGIQVGTEDSIIDNNVVEGISHTGGGGVSYGIFYSSNSTTDSLMVSNNVVRSTACRDGIYIDTDGGAVINGNQVMGFVRYGFYLNTLDGNTKSGSCEGNTISDNGIATDSPSAGIRLQRGSWSCVGNSITGSAMEYGIYVGSTPDDVVIASNFLNAGTTNAIIVNSGADPHIVHGNSIVSGSIANNNASKVFNNMIGGVLDSAPGILCAGWFTVGASTATLQPGSVNITSVTHNSSSDELTVNFTDDAAGTDYVVMVTQNTGAADEADKLLDVANKQVGSFRLDYENSNYPTVVYVVAYEF